MTSDPTPPDAEPGPDAEAQRAERLLSEGLGPVGPSGAAPTLQDIASRFPELEIVEAIGEGGMGVVYKARQPHLDRVVALKVLRRELAEDPSFAERFAREARALARLDHPHVVKVFDFGERQGLYFLLLEHVDGASLRDLIETGKLAPTEALAIVPQICEALQYAHDQGVVHRDIKPENVLMDERGRVKIADFGLAKLVAADTKPPTLTGTRQVMGTWQYMAPEQYRAPQDVDHRADIFSLGVVFYEMLTGELPVGRFRQPSEAQDLDQRIDDVVMRALEREREARYQRADEVKDDVEGIRDPEHGSAPRPGAAGGVARESAEGGIWWFVPSLLMPVVAWGGARATQQFVLTIRSYRTANLWMAIVGAAIALIGIGLGVVALRRSRGRGRIGAMVSIAVNLLVIPVVWLLAAQSTYRSEQRWLGFDPPPARNRSLSAVDPRLRELTDGAPLPTVAGGAASRDAITLSLLEIWQAWTRRQGPHPLSPDDASHYYTAASADRIDRFDRDALRRNVEALRVGVGFVTEAQLGIAPKDLYLHFIRLDGDRGMAEARPRRGGDSPIVRFPVALDVQRGDWRFEASEVWIIRK